MGVWCCEAGGRVETRDERMDGDVGVEEEEKSCTVKSQWSGSSEMGDHWVSLWARQEGFSSC